MTTSALISLAFQASIALTVFSYGLSARRDDVWYVFRRPRLLLLSILAMFVIMPVFALALASYLDLSPATRVALVALAVSPIPQLLPRTTIESGGRASYAYGLAFSLSVLSLVIGPALVSFFGRVLGQPFAAPIDVVARVLVPTVLAPLALGFLGGRLWPRLARAVERPLTRLANLVLLLALLLLLIAVFPGMLAVASLSTVVALVAFVAAGLAVGDLMAGPDPDQAIVLAIACATRNPGIAIAIATAVYPAQEFAALIILYAVLGGIASKPYLAWRRRKLALTPRRDAEISPPPRIGRTENPETINGD